MRRRLPLFSSLLVALACATTQAPSGDLRVSTWKSDYAAAENDPTPEGAHKRAELIYSLFSEQRLHPWGPGFKSQALYDRGVGDAMTWALAGPAEAARWEAVSAFRPLGVFPQALILERACAAADASGTSPAAGELCADLLADKGDLPAALARYVTVASRQEAEATDAVDRILDLAPTAAQIAAFPPAVQSQLQARQAVRTQSDQAMEACMRRCLALAGAQQQAPLTNGMIHLPNQTAPPPACVPTCRRRVAAEAAAPARADR